jgi:hypothetical protein
MTTSDGIQYVQSVLREDSNSDRVTTLQLISAANAGCIDMFKNSRCASQSFIYTTTPLQSTYTVDSSLFQIISVRYGGRKLHERRVAMHDGWHGSVPTEYSRQSATTIMLHPTPMTATTLEVLGYITPSVMNTLYPLLQVFNTLPSPPPSDYTLVSSGTSMQMLTSVLPVPPPEVYTMKYNVYDTGTGLFTLTDTLTIPPPTTYTTLYSYQTESTTQYVVGTFALTPDCDNGPWDYAVMRLAATVLADDAGAQTRAKSCQALYEQSWRALSARMW